MMHGKVNWKHGNRQKAKVSRGIALGQISGVYSALFETPAPMAYGHKTQSFMKNGGQQKCLDKSLHSSTWWYSVAKW